MTEPSKGEEKTMAYGTEIQEIMGRGYGEVGTPWRIAEERKSVGIGEWMSLDYQTDKSRVGFEGKPSAHLAQLNAKTVADVRNRILLRPPETTNNIRSLKIRSTNPTSRRITVPTSLMERIL